MTVRKHLWAYIRSKGLQQGTYIDPDPKLRAVFGASHPVSEGDIERLVRTVGEDDS
jgi:chromatin remodeling complex protein RSC6